MDFIEIRNLYLHLISELLEGVLSNDVVIATSVMQYDNLKYKNFNVNGSMHDSLLHIAAYNKNHKLCKMLLKFGADVNMLNKKGQSPLHVAEANANSDMCKLLVKKRKRQEESIRYKKVLHICVRKEDFAMCKTHILSNKVDVNETDERMRTPLHVAVIHASDKICDLLLEHGADIYAKDTYNDSPMNLAFYYNRPDLRERLLAYLSYFG